MKLGHFITVLIATMLAAAIGFSLLTKQQGEQSFERTNLIKDFDFDQVYKVNIEGQGQAVTLHKQLATWQVQQAHYYFADVEQLSSLLQQLKQAQIQEYKTRNSRYYARLGLAGISAENSDSLLITLTNNSKEVAVLLGSEVRSGKGRYAKLASAEQTYLLNTDINVKPAPKGWVQKRILPYNFDDIRQLNWSDNEGAAFSIERKEELLTGELEVNNGQPELPTGARKLKPDFELVTPDENSEPMYKSVFSGLVKNTIQIELEGVLPKDSLDLANQEATYTIELIAEVNGQNETKLLRFYQLESEQYWIAVEGINWRYQISEYSYKQLGKPIHDYLSE